MEVREPVQGASAGLYGGMGASAGSGVSKWRRTVTYHTTARFPLIVFNLLWSVHLVTTDKMLTRVMYCISINQITASHSVKSPSQ